MSKINQARAIAAQHPEANRQELIELFLEHIPGISHGAANTYSSSVKKELIEQAPKTITIHHKEPETDEEIDKRLNEKFEMIDLLSNASCNGQIRSLIIAGAPGVGKSYSVRQALEKYDPQGKKSIMASGFSRATGIYLLLHEYRHPGNVIVLDDVDSAFSDEVSLNLLKAALDTSHKRIISWRSETRMQDVDGNDIDREFEYKGTIIILSNMDFEREAAKGNKMSPHLEALMSRSMYVNVDLHTSRDYFIRIKQVVKQGMLRTKGINESQENKILSFFETNLEKFRELSLRAILKLADLYKIDDNKFEALAKAALFKPRHQH